MTSPGPPFRWRSIRARVALAWVVVVALSLGAIPVGGEDQHGRLAWLLTQWLPGLGFGVAMASGLARFERERWPRVIAWICVSTIAWRAAIEVVIRMVGLTEEGDAWIDGSNSWTIGAPLSLFLAGLLGSAILSAGHAVLITGWIAVDAQHVVWWGTMLGTGMILLLFVAPALIPALLVWQLAVAYQLEQWTQDYPRRPRPSPLL